MTATLPTEPNPKPERLLDEPLAQAAVPAATQATAGSALPETPIDFEASLAQLEAIIVQLESGKLSLEAALNQYEAGVRLVQKCRQALQAAEERLITIEALQRGDATS